MLGRARKAAQFRDRAEITKLVEFHYKILIQSVAQCLRQAGTAAVDLALQLLTGAHGTSLASLKDKIVFAPDRRQRAPVAGM